jgi:adenosylcobyric acid synthase
VLLGSVIENTSTTDYHQKNERLFETAADALQRLRADYDVVVMEGAGSCAEVNLMANDIVNLRMAEYADAPVILVADIHRGGVFAQIVGTLECLPVAQQELIKGFIINRFRGDIRLFEDGVRWIEAKTGKKVYGVLPWYEHIHIEPEDSVVIERPARAFPANPQTPAIAVIRLPHISNFNDFDPLMVLEGIDVYFVEKTQDLTNFKAVILPGSKNTRWDLDWLYSSGWTEKIKKYVAQSGHILGICGGYQMMGCQVHDPDGLEGRPGSTFGLDLLPVETELKAPKTTTLTAFTWQADSGTGYEIHMGQTRRLAGDPLFRVQSRNGLTTNDDDGCVVKNGRVMGTYIHGIFENPKITSRWLTSIGLTDIETSDLEGFDARDKEYELLAEHFKEHIDVENIADILGLKVDTHA